MKYFIFLFLCLNLIGCNNEKSSESSSSNKPIEIINLKSTAISLEGNLLYPFNLWLKDSLLVVLDKGNKTGMLNFFDLSNNMNFIRKTGSEGKGPGEFIGLKTIEFLDDNLWAFDVTANHITRLNIDSLISFPDYNSDYRLTIKKHPRDPKLTNFLIIDKDHFLGSFFGREPRFAIYNWKDMTIDISFLDYPNLVDDPENPTQKYNMFVKGSLFQASISKHPNRDIIAVSYPFCSRIEIVDIEKGKIIREILGPKENHLPHYRINEQGRGVQTPDNIRGYIKTVSTGDYMLSLYNGSKAKDRKHECNQILVYDWEGNLISEYKLDKGITDFVYYEKEKCIYAISMESPGSILKFEVTI